VTDHDAHANSFGPVASTYERGRPPYPETALDWLLEPRAGWQPRQVLDLGAGTGKLTRQIAARGLAVTAVDPSDGMLAELGRILPETPALVGTAEGIPLADHSVDVVLVAQAWHWVDAGQAVPEVARVLSPGGRLGLLWNLRDETVDWVRRLGEIMSTNDSPRQTGRQRPARFLDGDVRAPFATEEIRRFGWTHPMTPRQVLDMVASRSGVIMMEPQRRAEVLDGIRDLLATHPGLTGRTTIAMPYVTECIRADLPLS
jgi:SAM-dependent methyltransferase